MTDQPRPVWLTREQRDMLFAHGEDEAAYAWDAAPADAVEHAAMGLFAGGLEVWKSLSESTREFYRCDVELVLRALGMPS